MTSVRRPPIDGEENVSKCSDPLLIMNAGMVHSDNFAPATPPKASKPTPPPRPSVDKGLITPPHQPTPPGRGFNPEGSADMSPSYSESTSGSTPPHIRWSEGIDALLEDSTGTQLYIEYLKQENLHHHLEFFLACRGFKNTDVTAQEQLAMKFARNMRRTYLTKNMPVAEETKELICRKIDEIKHKQAERKHLRSSGLEPPPLTEPLWDANLFDGAEEEIKNHMARTSYPNFLKSEVLVNYVRSLDSRPHSSASSMSGRDHTTHREPVPHPSSHPPAPAKQWPYINNPEQRLSEQPPPPTFTNSFIANLSDSSFDDSMMSSSMTSSAFTASSSFGGYSSLPTIDEASSGSVEKSSLPFGGARPKQSIPTTTVRQPQYDAPFPRSRLDPKNPSFAYHANSSAFLPNTARQSETQSMSSGAQGDQTDDNYSSFTDTSKMSGRASKRHDRREEKRFASKVKENVEKNFGIKDSMDKMRPTSHKAPNPFHQPGHRAVKPAGGPADSTIMAETDPKAFGALLIEKLNFVLENKEKEEKLQECLQQCEASGSSVVSGASLNERLMTNLRVKDKKKSSSRLLDLASSVIVTNETDDSILDEHISTTLKSPAEPRRSHRPKATKYYPTQGSHSTLPNRSSHGPFNSMNSTKLMNQSLDYTTDYTRQMPGDLHNVSRRQQLAQHNASFGAYNKHDQTAHWAWNQTQHRTQSVDRLHSSWAAPPASAAPSSVMMQSYPTQSKIQVLYEFEMGDVYCVRLPPMPPINLKSVKHHMPPVNRKSGYFEIWIKNKEDALEYFEQYKDEGAPLPVIEGKIHVKVKFEK